MTCNQDHCICVNKKTSLSITNYSRDELPNVVKISDIVTRIQKVAELAIWENGGRKVIENAKTKYLVNCDF